MGNALSPSPTVNYGFLAASYTFLAAVSAVLYVLQQQGVHAVEGFWIIPAPCAVGILWALLLRARQKSIGREGKNE